MIDLEDLRNRMVDEQLIPRGIKDGRVLAAMRRVPRHLFIDEFLRDQAYGDYALSIGEGQTISQPYMVGVMTEALELKGGESVLEIGTGSGYQTAVLAEIAGALPALSEAKTVPALVSRSPERSEGEAKNVYTIERVASLAMRAKRLLDELGYTNISIRIFNGTIGWKEEGPFDGILVTAGAPDIPETLIDQLIEGGRLVIPVGDRYSQMLTKVVKTSDGVVTTPLLPCVFVPLIGEYGWER